MNSSARITNNKKLNGILTLCGVALGLFCAISPGIAVSLLIYGIMGFTIWKFSEKEDRNFLVKLFIFAILVRIILCIAVHFYSVSIDRYGTLFNDDVGGPRMGWRIAQFYKGKIDSISDPLGEKQFYHYFLGFLYYLFGFSRLTSKMFSILFGALSGIFIYYLSIYIFSKKVAKLSAILVSFFPSLILWSILNLKEIMVILLLIVILWATIKFQDGNRLRYIFVVVVSLLAIFSVRKLLFLLLVAIIPLSFIFSLRRKGFRLAIALLLIVGAIFLTSSVENLIQSKYSGFQLNLNRLLITHLGYISSGGSVYKIYDEALYHTPYPSIKLFSFAFLRAFINGWFYFMLVPLPWQIYTKVQLISLPQMIFWIMLLPFSLLGILLGIRYRWKKSFPIVLFLFVITSAYALSEGNIGTAARHRDMVTPFYLVFSVAGILKFLIGKKILTVKTTNLNQTKT